MEKIQDIKKDSFFKKKEGAKKIFIKGNYCLINKAWECMNFDNISEFIYLKKNKEVFTDFEF